VPGLRWGVLGTGWIAERFVRALRAATTQQVVAVGSRTQASAERFAGAAAGTLLPTQRNRTGTTIPAESPVRQRPVGDKGPTICQGMRPPTALVYRPTILAAMDAEAGVGPLDQAMVTSAAAVRPAINPV
jgi:hypothetical protein